MSSTSLVRKASYHSHPDIMGYDLESLQVIHAEKYRTHHLQEIINFEGRDIYAQTADRDNSQIVRGTFGKGDCYSFSAPRWTVRLVPSDDKVDIFDLSTASKEPDHRYTPRNGPKTWEVD